MTVEQIRKRLENHINDLYEETILTPTTEYKYIQISYQLQGAVKLAYRLGFELMFQGDHYIVLG